MNKSVLALGTALSIFAFTPAIAQESSTVDCTVAANAKDPACVNQTNMNNNQSGTTADQSNAQTGTGTTTDQNNAQTTAPGTTNTQMSANDLFVPADRLNNSQVMSASDFIGKTIYDETGSNIGEVNDLIISQTGDIQAVILGVGGFLGMGEKDVAVAINAVKMVQDGDTRRLVVQATKETLESAPTYDRNNRRYSGDGVVPGDQTGSITPAPGTVPAGGADNDPNTPQ